MRHNFVSAIVIFMIVALHGICCAQTDAISSKDLIDMANALDGKAVKYKGEAVSAIMKRGEHSWINLNDGFNAIGVWCVTSSLDNVSIFGDYGHEGDTLEVTGIFHRACPEHGGELDIHADNVRIVATGFPVEDHVPVSRINLAVAFFILTLLAIFIFRKRI